MALVRTAMDADRFWAHVAAFGALWGSIEITLGAFVHTLRLPLAGVLLAALGAAVLTAERQIIPARGTTLATGIVAALCKTISPGGIVLGPMIGILAESLLVEIALLAAPRSRLAVALAGALCVSWSLMQAVGTQYVVYGKGVLDLFLAALSRAGNWLGLSSAAGLGALAACAGLLCLIGAAGGLAGRALGIRARTGLRLDGDAQDE